MKEKIVSCVNCHHVMGFDNAADLNHCVGCEEDFCGPCFQKHECLWHEPELKMCEKCGKDVPASEIQDEWCKACNQETLYKGKVDL